MGTSSVSGTSVALTVAGKAPNRPSIPNSGLVRGGRNALEAYQALATAVAVTAVTDWVGWGDELAKARKDLAETKQRLRDVRRDPDATAGQIDRVKQKATLAEERVGKAEGQLARLRRFFSAEWKLMAGDADPYVLASIVRELVKKPEEYGIEDVDSKTLRGAISEVVVAREGATEEGRQEAVRRQRALLREIVRRARRARTGEE